MSRNIDDRLVKNAAGTEVSGANARNKKRCRKNQPELEAKTPEMPEMMTLKSSVVA